MARATRSRSGSSRGARPKSRHTSSNAISGRFASDYDFSAGPCVWRMVGEIVLAERQTELERGRLTSACRKGEALNAGRAARNFWCPSYSSILLNSLVPSRRTIGRVLSLAGCLRLRRAGRARGAICGGGRGFGYSERYQSDSSHSADK
jgi:hypothetical protein